MGEAKRTQYNREQFLIRNPWCAYCGKQATTTDHCPPRAFFVNRVWPEKYEFPACAACNGEARLDEQAVAVIARLNLSDRSANDQREWERLVDGVKNNRPELIAEWRSMSEARRKLSMRELFGSAGDEMRLAGWGTINLGPETFATVTRFMVKLGKAHSDYGRWLGVGGTDCRTRPS
jgi:hypothetical protein